MNKNLQLKKIALYSAFASTIILAACGGGGGSNGATGTSTATSGAAPAGGASSTAPTSTTVPGTVSTPQYAAGSIQLAMFNQVNAYRQQCGFPAVQENTTLDQSVAAHTQYMDLNNISTDTEVAGNQGFTGVNYLDRAVHFGAPANLVGGGVSGGLAYSGTPMTADQSGQFLANGWLTAVYHAPLILAPISLIGVGEDQSTAGGITSAWGSITLQDVSYAQLSQAPLTFPCQGVTGVPYSNTNENPTPPNTSGSWGTPVTVIGNATDTIVVQSANITGPSGPVAVQILDSANDPNKELPAYAGSVYPTAPLAANATYSVSLSGTDNGVPFSRSFSFTTGTVAE
jgi:uncharacterized protein YkwD